MTYVNNFAIIIDKNIVLTCYQLVTDILILSKFYMIKKSS